MCIRDSQKACGVTKLTTVTLHVDHLKQAVGDAAGDKLANGGTGNVAVCPRAVLLAMGEKKPPAKSAGK
jgi:hypothetical protein